jgi:hypothetical protein
MNKIWESIKKNKSKKWIAVLFAFIVISVIFYYASPNIADPDGFYHLKHAQIYKDIGIFTKDFPWVQYSSISVLKSDLWYGFHILLIPFSGFDSANGIKIAGIFLTTISLFIFWLAFKRTIYGFAFLWTILIFISAPNIMTRFIMLRPHLLTMAISALIFSFLIRGKPIWIFVLSAILAWIHISMSWIVILVLGIVFFLKIIIEKEWIWKKTFSVIAGIALGLLARPNAIGSIKLTYIQIIKLLQVKQEGAALLFGSELFPLDWNTLAENFLTFTVLSVVSVFIFFAFYKKYLGKEIAEKKVFIISSLILSVVFFGMTMLTARRAHDFWIVFGVMFIAGMFHLVTSKKYSNDSIKTAFVSVLAISFVFLVFYTPYKSLTTLRNRGTPPDAFKKASEWIKENSNPGDIVFNLHWSDFPMLFFWNSKNYYIGGMDPIFQYSFNESLYWKFHYLSIDEVTKKTCGAPACTVEMLEDTYYSLKNEFKAKYIVLEKYKNQAVYQYLSSDTEHYEKKLDLDSESVFLIK